MHIYIHVYIYVCVCVSIYITRPTRNSTFNVHKHHGIKLLTRFQVRLNHLRKHKFRNNFQHSLDPFYDCGWHIETTIHFFLHCTNYSNLRKTLFDKTGNISVFNVYHQEGYVVCNLFFLIFFYCLFCISYS